MFAGSTGATVGVPGGSGGGGGVVDAAADRGGGEEVGVVEGSGGGEEVGVVDGGGGGGLMVDDSVVDGRAAEDEGVFALDTVVSGTMFMPESSVGGTCVASSVDLY